MNEEKKKVNVTIKAIAINLLRHDKNIDKT
jgi:hypothetical protein